MTKSRDKHHPHENPPPEPAVPADGPAPAKPAAEPPPPPTPSREEQLQDQLLRLRADYDNFRKRTLREKNELYEQANQDLMLALLPVLDHLQLGLAAARNHKADKAIQDGLGLIFDQLQGVLTQFGLQPFDAEKQPFDPDRHEAISYLPAKECPEGTVLTQIRQGYLLRHKLLRPAQVIVSSGPPGHSHPPPAKDTGTPPPGAASENPSDKTMDA